MSVDTSLGGYDAIIGLTWTLSEFATSGDAPSRADLTQQVRREIGFYYLAHRIGIDSQSLT